MESFEDFWKTIEINFKSVNLPTSFYAGIQMAGC